jgi:hypothetical protein
MASEPGGITLAAFELQNSAYPSGRSAISRPAAVFHTPPLLKAAKPSTSWLARLTGEGEKTSNRLLIDAG